MQYGFRVGQIVRHKGERKVIRQVYMDKNMVYTVEFVDRTICKDMKEIEMDGRK